MRVKIKSCLRLLYRDHKISGCTLRLTVLFICYHRWRLFCNPEFKNCQIRCYRLMISSTNSLHGVFCVYHHLIILPWYKIWANLYSWEILHSWDIKLNTSGTGDAWIIIELTDLLYILSYFMCRLSLYYHHVYVPKCHAVLCAPHAGYIEPHFSHAEAKQWSYYMPWNIISICYWHEYKDFAELWMWFALNRVINLSEREYARFIDYARWK